MSDTQQRLGRDVFLALAAIGWADGHLDADEADAIVRTASDEGLSLEEIQEIEQATKKPVDMVATIDRSAMSKEDRLFVYAVASWMVRLDGKSTEGELKALDQLGSLLKVPEAPRAHADSIAREVAALPDGDRPLRYDLPKLRSLITERLKEAQRLRAEAKATEEPKAEEPKAEEPKADASKADETKADASKADETKADASKADETKAAEGEAKAEG